MEKNNILTLYAAFHKAEIFDKLQLEDEELILSLPTEEFIETIIKRREK